MRLFNINTETHKESGRRKNYDEKDWALELVAANWISEKNRNKMADVYHALELILKQRKKIKILTDTVFSLVKEKLYHETKAKRWPGDDKKIVSTIQKTRKQRSRAKRI